MIEWYDFYLYGLAAALVFGKLYFPSQDPSRDAAGFFDLLPWLRGASRRRDHLRAFRRPHRSQGHSGRNIAPHGRQHRADSAFCRLTRRSASGARSDSCSCGCCQGIGVGGEWGGAIAVATEWSKFNKRRGLMASWPQFGSPLGMLLAVAALTITAKFGDAAWFESFGWRIPFLISAVLIIVGLYIRLGVLETPVFQQLQEKNKISKAPVLDAIKGYWRQILLTCLIRTGQQAPFVIFTTFLLSYGTTNLGLQKPFLFNCVLAAAALSLFTTPFFGYLSDRIGRKRMYLIGAATMLAFAFPYFWMLDTKIPALIVFAVMISLPIHDMQYAPQAAFIAESFPPSVRYSGSSLGYQLASITSGGPAPMICAYLMHTYGTSAAISTYIAVIAAISLVSAMLLKDRSKSDYTTNEGWDRDIAPDASSVAAATPAVRPGPAH